MLLTMEYREILLKKIDYEDETYRISEDLVSARLFESIREIGQLNPVVFLEENDRYRIVCGFRRVHALRQLNMSKVLCRVLELKDRASVDPFRYALWDNLSHRKLEPLETARAVHKLKVEFGLSDDLLIQEYLPRLGLPPRRKALDAQIMLHTSAAPVRKQFREGHLALSSVERLASMPSTSQETILSAMLKMRLSASLQRKLFALVEDLSAIDDSEPGAVFNDSEISGLLDNDRLSPGERGDRIYAILYRKRYPNVSKVGVEFQVKRKSLGLPGTIQITADPYFEKPDLSVEFTACNADHFRKLAKDLYEASRRNELDQLFRILE